MLRIYEYQKEGLYEDYKSEFLELKKRYWGRHFLAIGYGAWLTGDLTEELVQEYFEHLRNPSNVETGHSVQSR